MLAFYREPMRTASFQRTLTVLVVALGVLAAACSSSEPEETTTTIAVEDIAVDAAESMCRTLELLSSAGVSAGAASEAITVTDLDGISAQEMSAYGELLVRAPRAECTEQVEYADAVAYWLGL